MCSVRMYRAGQGRRHAGQQQGQQQQQPPSPLIQLMQFAPLILLLLFSFLSRPSQPVRGVVQEPCCGAGVSSCAAAEALLKLTGVPFRTSHLGPAQGLWVPRTCLVGAPRAGRVGTHAAWHMCAIRQARWVLHGGVG